MKKQINFSDVQVELINNIMSKRKCSFPEAVNWIIEVYTIFFTGNKIQTRKIHEMDEKINKLVLTMKAMKKKLN